MISNKIHKTKALIQKKMYLYILLKLLSFVIQLTIKWLHACIDLLPSLF